MSFTISKEEKNNITLMLMVTEACNLECTYCYETNKTPRNMTFETAKKILDREFERIEGKGIAVIQDLMIKREVKMVSEMVERHVINANNYLLKDGSLEYKVDDIKNAREKRKFAGYFSFRIIPFLH